MKEIQEAAKRIYWVLGCKGFARVDLFLTPEGELVFNEVNTIPGFTPYSRYPNMMKQIGLSYGEEMCIRDSPHCGERRNVHRRKL